MLLQFSDKSRCVKHLTPGKHDSRTNGPPEASTPRKTKCTPTAASLHANPSKTFLE